MIRFTHILCPVDLSDVSAGALRHARALAQWYEASLTVLEVISVAEVPMAYAAATGGVIPLPPSVEEREAALEALAAFGGVDRRAGNVRVVVREGPIVAQVLAEARESRADLIVMGTHGRGGFDRFLLGSVTEKIVRRAPCPVMTIPPAGEHAPAANRFETIVCAVDFSPSSLNALGYALSLAQETQAALVLLHVVEWPSDRPLPPWAGPTFAAHQRQMRDDALRELHLAVPDEARVWCRADEVVALGRAHEEIARVARDRHADLIVLGIHGRAEASVAFFGSTATQVIRHSGCPVLTIRPVTVDHR